MDTALRDNHLRVLWEARMNYTKNSRVTPHVHDDFYQLLYVIEGVGVITIHDQSFSIINNHCYLFPQGVIHSLYFTQDSLTLDFKFSMEKELANHILLNYRIGPFFVRNKNHFMDLFRLSCDQLQGSQNSLLRYHIDTGFKYSLLSMIQDQYTSQTPNEKPSADSLPTPCDHPGIQYLIDYLQRNLQSKMNLDEIASHMGFHPHYLIELFHRYVGTTPIQYLQQLRLEKAKEYLEYTNHSITEIAEMVGLSAPYFSRLFCERVGSSPSQFREKKRTITGKNIILEEKFQIDSQPIILTL